MVFKDIDNCMVEYKIYLLQFFIRLSKLSVVRLVRELNNNLKYIIVGFLFEMHYPMQNI